jgi:hydrogenase nickel incorporation protein HypB
MHANTRLDGLTHRLGDGRLRRALAALGGGLPLSLHRFGHGDEADGDPGDAGVVVDADGADDVLAAYREAAAALHETLAHDRGVFVVEFLGGTGSGKTSLLEHLLAGPFADASVGVVAGDVAGDDDARRLRAAGATVESVNTGRECHLDPGLVGDAVEAFDLDALDALFVENVGNMVCPADFPLGAERRVLTVSTTEGDDVVRKHPALFEACDATVVNKTDLADAVGADVERMLADAAAANPDLRRFATSVETGRGLDAFDEYLRAAYEGRPSEHRDAGPDARPAGSGSEAAATDPPGEGPE